MSGSGPIYEYQRELTAKLEQVMRERDEAVKRLGVTVERWGATERERDEARQYAEERNDEANKLQRLLNMAAQERDEARAEVERLRGELAKVQWYHAEYVRLSCVTTARHQREACACQIEECAEREPSDLHHAGMTIAAGKARATPLVTEGDK